MNDRRTQYLTEFYQLLTQLERKLGGTRRLSECSGGMSWPQRGVYFFRETGEVRTDTGDGPRIVRVGTHALKAGARATLWGRLKQHKGTDKPVGGTHRSSVFRQVVGAALIAKYGNSYPNWGQGNSAPKGVTESERPLERDVSEVIGAMPFLLLTVDDEPGPDSWRGYIERNAIALLSNYGRESIDPPSAGWLGYCSDRERVRQSGLWNNNHVDAPCDPAFLETLQRFIELMR